MNRYKGRRFAAFLICAGLLGAAFFFGPPENFAAFSQAMAGLFGAYVLGQSATDWRQLSNGGAQNNG